MMARPIGAFWLDARQWLDVLCVIRDDATSSAATLNGHWDVFFMLLLLYQYGVSLVVTIVFQSILSRHIKK